MGFRVQGSGLGFRLGSGFLRYTLNPKLQRALHTNNLHACLPTFMNICVWFRLLDSGLWTVGVGLLSRKSRAGASERVLFVNITV